MLRSLLTVALLAVVSPSDTLACGPAPGVQHTNPRPGDGWPANAAVLLWGYELEAAGLEATVDGEAAVLEAAHDLPGGLAVRVVPEPAAGATVRLRGVPCTDCPEVELTYEVAAPLPEDPLAAPESLSIDLHDYAGGGGGCSVEETHTWYLRVALPDASEHARWVRFWSDGDDPLNAFDVVWPVRDGAAVVQVVGEESDADPRALCASAEVLDARGRRSAVVSTCGVCRVLSRALTEQEAAGDDADFSALPASGECPAGVPADPPVAGDEGADGVGDGSGGCQSVPGQGPLAPAVLALFGVLVGRRRRIGQATHG